MAWEAKWLFVEELGDFENILLTFKTYESQHSQNHSSYMLDTINLHLFFFRHNEGTSRVQR